MRWKRGEVREEKGEEGGGGKAPADEDAGAESFFERFFELFLSRRGVR